MLKSNRIYVGYGGKKFTAVNSATRVWISATGEFTCGIPAPETEDGHGDPPRWPAQARSLVASVSNMDHFDRSKTFGYHKKKNRIYVHIYMEHYSFDNLRWRHPTIWIWIPIYNTTSIGNYNVRAK